MPNPTSCSVAVPAVASPTSAQPTHWLNRFRPSVTIRGTTHPAGFGTEFIRWWQAPSEPQVLEDRLGVLNGWLVAEGHKHRQGRVAVHRRQRRQEAFQVSACLRHAAAAKQQDAAAALQACGCGCRFQPIHHGVSGGQGRHSPAFEATGGECIAHGDQLAAPMAHEHPFPGIPFASLAAVIAIAELTAWSAPPGVVTLWCADEAKPCTTAPGHQQGQQIANSQHRCPALSPPAHQPPLPPAEQGESRPQICHQAAQALVAETATGQACPRPDLRQPSGLLGGSKGAAHADEWHHLKLGTGMVGSKLLKNAQSDEVFPMTIAQNQ